MRIVYAVVLLLVAGMCAAGVPHFDDADTRARYQSLTAELRCVICLNQSIATSTAPLALDMRQLVADKIRAGYTNAEIKDFLVARYGTFVLYEPPFSPATWLLWLGPGVLLLLGLTLAVVLIRRSRHGRSAPAHVDHERVARIVDEDTSGEHRS